MAYADNFVSFTLMPENMEHVSLFPTAYIFLPYGDFDNVNQAANETNNQNKNNVPINPTPPDANDLIAFGILHNC